MERGGYGGNPAGSAGHHGGGGGRGRGRVMGRRGENDGVAGGRGRGNVYWQHRLWEHHQQSWEDGRTQNQWHSSSGRRGGGGFGGSRVGRGGGGGRGPTSYVAESQESLPEPIVPAMQSQKISGDLPSPSSPSEFADKLVPMKQPANEGKNNIQSIRLVVNHFLLSYKPEIIIRHYDIDVKSDLLPKNGLPVKVPKAVLSMIRNKLFFDDPTRFPLSMTAYDGEKNIFSSVPLPTGQFKVKLSDDGGLKIRSFICELQLVNELKCDRLDDYLRDKNLSIPRDVLQALDVVMKENPARQMIYVGRSFHPMVPDPKDDLGHGITASKGIKHSLKLTSQGPALCLDYSVLPLHKQMPVLDFLKEHIHSFDLNNFRVFRRQVEKILKGLKVTVTHRTTHQKFRIAGLTDENTQDISFDDKDLMTKVRIVDYFREKYSKEIRFKNIPCLDLGKSNKTNYVPMEFCVIAVGQRFPKDLLDKIDRYSSEKLRKISLAPPSARQRTIYEMVRSGLGPCGGDISQNFGIKADMNMTTVIGRVIGPPELKLGTSRGRWMMATVDREKCDWNLQRNTVISSRPIRVWGVLDFGTLNIDRFIPELIARCKRLDIHMEQPFYNQRHPINLLYNVDHLHQLLESIENMSTGSLQILVCILPRVEPGYNNLKWICETKLGIQTQCCLSTNANKVKDQFLANLALKINAKLGGTNVELMKQPQCLQNKGHVMFVGADVSLPGSYNSTSPSIAAVAASMNWPAANQYVTRISPQQHRTEKILKFGGMCLELVNAYAQLNQVRPDMVVIFRDGVSESRFDMVFNEELMDLKMTFRAANYFPKITLIVVQKRHSTRLFVDSGKDKNVPPGTVVDTKIVHPFGLDFYLCSHYGQIGTSKPAYYHVLLDENAFTSDEVEELTHSMCFTSAQCTKPVSLVPPVCYADRAAYRGRLYHDSMERNQSSCSLSSSQPSSSSVASFDEQLYRQHPVLENTMYFI